MSVVSVIDVYVFPPVSASQFSTLPRLPLNESVALLVPVHTSVPPLTAPAIVGGAVVTGNVAVRFAQLFCSWAFTDPVSLPIVNCSTLLSELPTTVQSPGKLHW